MVPWLLGVAPFGLVVGVSAAQAGIPTLVGWATGPIIYSGSAQVATIELLDGGATPLVVVATALAINLRLVLYSGAMAARWRGQPRWWRMIAAHLLVDPSFAVGTARYQRPGGDGVPAHAHFLGGAVALWCTWVTAITLGATLGTHLPAGLHLELIVPLFLIGEVVPRMTTRAMRRATAVGAVVALAAGALPLRLGLVAAMVAGVVAGLTTKEAGR